jgi:hypothetical protein
MATNFKDFRSQWWWLPPPWQCVEMHWSTWHQRENNFNFSYQKEGRYQFWLLIDFHPAQENFTYMDTLPLLVKGCKFRRSGSLSREGSLSYQTCCDTGPRFIRFHLQDRPFSRLLRHTMGCGGSILTRILTGLPILSTNLNNSNEAYRP